MGSREYVELLRTGDRHGKGKERLRRMQRLKESCRRVSNNYVDIFERGLQTLRLWFVLLNEEAALALGLSTAEEP